MKMTGLLSRIELPSPDDHCDECKWSPDRHEIRPLTWWQQLENEFGEDDWFTESD